MKIIIDILNDTYWKINFTKQQLNDLEKWFISNPFEIKNNAKYLKRNGYSIFWYEEPKRLDVQGKGKTIKIEVLSIIKEINPKFVPEFHNEKNAIIHKPKPQKILDFELEEENYVGMDESGKGEDFGSVVFCSVTVQQSDFQKLTDFGINDSKKLTDMKIIQLREQISKLIQQKNILYSFASPSELHNAREKGSNLNEVMCYHYELLIKQACINRDINHNVVIDKFTSHKIQIENIENLSSYNSEIKLIEKADQEYISVMCASIFARAKYLDIIQEISRKYNFDLTIGANFEKNIKPFIDHLIRSKRPKQEIEKIVRETIKNRIEDAIDYVNKTYKVN
ncbi:MAG: hypothetical protein ACRAS9_02095 [Mycoplasma sp.]